MKTIFFLIAWFIAISCRAQDSPPINTISVQAGPAYLMRQDLIFSPNVHSDLTFLNLGLNYSRKANFFQNAGIQFSGFSPMISESYEFTVEGQKNTAYPHNFTFIDLDYQIGKEIINSSNSSLILGAGFSSDIQMLNYYYGRISSFGYYSNIGLGIFGQLERSLAEKSNLVATLQIPLLSWVARSPYLVNDDEFIENISSHSTFQTFMAFIGDGRLTSWDKLQTLDFELMYEYKLSPKWLLGVAYQFDFIHMNHPRNLLSFRNTFNISVNFRFS